jgi:hypothetical protein
MFAYGPTDLQKIPHNISESLPAGLAIGRSHKGWEAAEGFFEFTAKFPISLAAVKIMTSPSVTTSRTLHETLMSYSGFLTLSKCHPHSLAQSKYLD